MQPTLPNILIVDDTPANIIVMRTVLHDIKANIKEATNGPEALRISATETFALILLDIQMPDMDGYQVAEELRQYNHTANIPIIFVTAKYSEDTDRLRGYDSGAVDYMTKPISKTILKSKVNIFLELYNKQAEIERQRLLLAELNEAMLDAHRNKTSQQDLQNQALHDLLHSIQMPLNKIAKQSKILSSLADITHARDTGTILQAAVDEIFSYIATLQKKQ